MAALNLGSANRALVVPASAFSSLSYGGVSLTVEDAPHSVVTVSGFPAIVMEESLISSAPVALSPTTAQVLFVVLSNISSLTGDDNVYIYDINGLAISVHGTEIYGPWDGEPLPIGDVEGIYIIGVNRTDAVIKLAAVPVEDPISGGGAIETSEVQVLNEDPSVLWALGDPNFAPSEVGLLGAWSFDNVVVDDATFEDTLVLIASLFTGGPDPDPDIDYEFPNPEGDGFYVYTVAQANDVIRGALAEVVGGDMSNKADLVDGRVPSYQMPEIYENPETFGGIILEQTLAAVPVELPTIDESNDDEVLTAVGGEWVSAPLPEAPDALPAVGDEADVLTVVGGEWASAPPTGGGSTPLVQLDHISVSGTGTIALAAVGTIVAVEFSAAARLRLYRTTAGRTADAARAFATPYSGGATLQYDYNAVGAETDNEAPASFAWAVGDTTLYYNLEGSATVQVHWIPTGEA